MSHALSRRLSSISQSGLEGNGENLLYRFTPLFIADSYLVKLTLVDLLADVRDVLSYQEFTQEQDGPMSQPPYLEPSYGDSVCLICLLHLLCLASLPFLGCIFFDLVPNVFCPRSFMCCDYNASYAFMHTHINGHIHTYIYTYDGNSGTNNPHTLTQQSPYKLSPCDNKQTRNDRQKGTKFSSNHCLITVFLIVHLFDIFHERYSLSST